MDNPEHMRNCGSDLTDNADPHMAQVHVLPKPPREMPLGGKRHPNGTYSPPPASSAPNQPKASPLGRFSRPPKSALNQIPAISKAGRKKTRTMRTENYILSYAQNKIHTRPTTTSPYI